MKIIFLGAPGVGKGTHAGHLGKDLGIPHISTGDMFREAVEQKTEIGLKAKSYMDKGDLVPDEIVIGIVEERLRRPDCKKGFLLDGFPRTQAQAKALDERLKQMGTALDYAVYFVADEKDLIDRLTGRRFCSVCNTAYHVRNNPPRKEDYCDRCPEQKLYQREDDREETILNRLDVFKKKSQPLFDYYQEKKILKKIHTGQAIEKTYADLRTAVELR